MAILDLFPGIIVLFGCVSAIIDLMFFICSGYLRSMFRVWRNRLLIYTNRMCEKRSWISGTLSKEAGH